MKRTFILLVGVLGAIGCAQPSAPLPAIGPTALKGEHGFVVAYRSEGTVGVRALTPARGPAGSLTLSHAAEASQPIVKASGEGALVAWSERDAADAPWRVRLVRFVPGTPVVSLDEHTTASNTAAPTLAWRDEDVQIGRESASITVGGAQ